MRLVVKLIVIGLVTSSLYSCVSQKKYDELSAAKEATDQALAQTQEKMKTLEEDMKSLESEMESQKSNYESEISKINSDLKAKDSKIAQVEGQLTATKEELEAVKKEINGIFATYTKSGLSMEERDGDLYIVTSTPVNYRSGSTYIDSEERKAIDELAKTLKNNPNVKVLIEGHTDTDKLIPGAAYADNWELSVARATKVVRRLVKMGVNPEQVAAAGKGEHDPLADNKTSEGKAKNRRTSVKANPDLGKLKNIVNEK